MHAGKLTGNTAAARVYDVLRERQGVFVGGMDLTLLARVTAVSTRISEVRRQLAKGERIERTQGPDRSQYYRLVTDEVTG